MGKALNIDDILKEGQRLAELLIKKHGSTISPQGRNRVDLDDQYNYLHYYDVEENQWFIKEK